MSMNVLVVGSGAMAKEYIKVLKALNTPVTVVGRSATGVENFKRDTGIAALSGGLEANIGTLDIASFTHCIVTTNVTQLYGNVRSLLFAGAKRFSSRSRSSWTKSRWMMPIAWPKPILLKSSLPTIGDSSAR